MSTPPSFSAWLPKGDNIRAFLFAYLENEVLLKRGLLLKKEFASKEANSFLSELTPYEMGGKMKMKKELLPLKIYPLTPHTHSGESNSSSYHFLCPFLM